MIIIKNNEELISISNPKIIFIKDNILTVRTKEGKEYKGTFVSYE